MARMESLTGCAARRKSSSETLPAPHHSRGLPLPGVASRDWMASEASRDKFLPSLGIYKGAAASALVPNGAAKERCTSREAERRAAVRASRLSGVPVGPGPLRSCGQVGDDGGGAVRKGKTVLRLAIPGRRSMEVHDRLENPPVDSAETVVKVAIAAKARL